MIRYDINTVRQLTDKFFNATITEKENEALAKFAKELTENGNNIVSSDPQLMADLQMIASLNDFSSHTLASLASRTPEGLEERLEKSISAMARESRWKRIKTAFIPAISAAAAVALIFTIGYRYTGAPEPQPSNENLNTTIYIAKIAEPKPVLQMTQAESAPKAVAENSKNAKKAAKSAGAVKHMMKNSIQSVVDEPEEQFAEIKLPENIGTIENIIPVLAAATIDPAQIALQPLSTLRNSVCNAYESVDMVSTAFAGIAETFSMVNNSLALLNPNLGQR